jgi:uncharacterized protein YbaR (Trm112 family)
MAAPRPLTQADLNLLVCPICHGTLTLEAEPSPASIRCTACQRRYPIVDGIPILLPHRAS